MAATDLHHARQGMAQGLDGGGPVARGMREQPPRGWYAHPLPDDGVVTLNGQRMPLDAGQPAARCFDASRARQTAAPIAGELALQPVAESGLREQSFGRVDGMRVDDIQRDHPEAWAGWLRFEEDFAMPEGESTRTFHARVMEAVQRVVAAHPKQRVVVVTHGGVLDMIYRTARSLGLNGPRQSDIPNAGFNRIRMRDGGIDILDWACTRHLADLPPQPVYDQKALVKDKEA